MISARETFLNSLFIYLTFSNTYNIICLDGTHTRKQGNLHENDNDGNVGYPAPNGNPETLTALAAQLVDLLKMGANANREVRQNAEEQRGCIFE
jgi:hypothetical protein